MIARFLPVAPAEEYELKAEALVAKMVPMLTRGAATRRDSYHAASATGLAREVLAFHGTPSYNIESIVRDGFRPGITGNYGGAVYTSCLASYSHTFVDSHDKERTMLGCRDKERTMLGCRVLVHDGEVRHDVNAVKDPARVLPVCLLHYTN